MTTNFELVKKAVLEKEKEIRGETSEPINPHHLVILVDIVSPVLIAALGKNIYPAHSHHLDAMCGSFDGKTLLGSRWLDILAPEDRIGAKFENIEQLISHRADELEKAMIPNRDGDEVMGTVADFRRHVRDSFVKAIEEMKRTGLAGAVLYRIQSAFITDNPFTNPIFHEEAAELGLRFIPIGAFRAKVTNQLPESYACVFDEARIDSVDLISFLEAAVGVKYDSAGAVKFS